MANRMSITDEERALDRQIGARVRRRRLELSLSQVDLGKGANVSFQQIQKYESGQDRISASRLVLIARKLETPIAYFFEPQSEN